MAMFFRGPHRWSAYPYPNEKSEYFDTGLADNEKCMMGDHLYPKKAFVSIVPNKFHLCTWHYVEMYDKLHEMLKTHYKNEPGRDWF